MFLRFLPLIVLSLPVAELLLDILLYRRYGDGFLWWLAGSGVAGIWLLLRARDAFGAALRTLSGGDARSMAASLWVLLAGARAFFAGLLLLFPGVLSDLLALVIVLLPGRAIQTLAQGPAAAAHDGVIEGEFREVKDETPRLR